MRLFVKRWVPVLQQGYHWCEFRETHNEKHCIPLGKHAEISILSQSVLKICCDHLQTRVEFGHSRSNHIGIGRAEVEVPYKSDWVDNCVILNDEIIC